MPQTTVSFDDDVIAPASTQSHAGSVLATPATSQFSLLQTPRLTVGLIALVLIVVIRILSASRSKKLPPGVKRLPRLPGKSLQCS